MANKKEEVKTIDFFECCKKVKKEGYKYIKKSKKIDEIWNYEIKNTGGKNFILIDGFTASVVLCIINNTSEERKKLLENKAYHDIIDICYRVYQKCK